MLNIVEAKLQVQLIVLNFFLETSKREVLMPRQDSFP